MFSRSTFLLLAPTLALGLAACRPAASDATRDDGPAVPVTTAVVQTSTDVGTRALPATVRPVAHATLAAQVPGTVARHDAALGRRVAAGDVLLTLESPTLAAAVAQAQATLDLAAAEHAREARLLAQGASTTELVRRLEDQRRIAAAALDQAAAQLAYTRVAAPFPGVVTARHVDAGDTVAPGRPLLALQGQDTLRVEVAVPASWPDQPLDTAIEVQLDGTATRVRGTLAEFSPAADPATRSRLAKLDLPAHPELISGAFARVLWPVAGESRLLVPDTALVNFGQLTRAYVVREDRARLRLVDPGPREGDLRVVFAGLEAGEVIILNPPAALRDGQLVEISP